MVTWRVDGGEGQFAGVTGLITSNFFVDDRLRVVDHHFGVVLVSEIAIQHRADKQAIAPCEKRKRTEAPPGGATIKERSGG